MRPLPFPRRLPVLLALLPLVAAPDLAAAPQGEAFASLQPRSLGPAGMSGRVAAIDAVERDPRTILVGGATGGLWRTDDGGLSWTPLFDDQPVSSIGAIAIWQRHPDVIWVGTGEGNPRNSSSVGNGVYRSLDGGATWAHLGLEHTEKIHRVVVHPDDPDTAWVAALGTTWGENEQRGVFKTTDGGATWRKVLYVDERTGASDLVLDPTNPRKLIATTWQHRRTPAHFTSGGPGSGIWVTLDGGETWERRGTEDGLPAGDLGRIGLAQCRTRPSVVYALVEAERNALLRSDDGGRSFRTVNTDPDVAPRPFYFCDVRVDPRDPDRVYSLHSIVTASSDGGRTFETLIPWSLIHPDHHALWIDPNDPDHLLDGNDGGVAFSRDRGASWRFARNLPMAQYYHVAVDLDVPYRIYGGMQDNGSWRGPSAVWENGGIRNHHWSEVGFGDGFACIPLPGHTTRGYGMSQGGALFRWDDVTGERKAIVPDGPEGVELRFNWNAGLAVDPFDPNGAYYGSQFVHRTRDLGDSWETVSGDLTTNNPEWQRQRESGGLTPDVTAAENHCSILTLAPSPIERGLLWVGTDDGRLHVTRDDCATWTSLEDRLFGVPRNTWIPHVEASRHDAARAYVVLDDHRRANGETYLFRTDDGGATFQRLACEGVRGHAHVVEEDPVDPDLLFLGTEFGLWVSRDRGATWTKWTSGFPTVPVRALVVHPRDHDLVIGTHGRALWVLDDVRALRARPEGAADATLDVLDCRPTIAYTVKQTGEARFPGTEEFRGENAPRGARIQFFVRGADDDELPDEATITIEGPGGAELRRLRVDVTRGLNRVLWDLRRHGVRGPGQTGPTLERGGGPEVLPGRYVARVRLGDHEGTAALQVLPDPRQRVEDADRLAKQQALLEAQDVQERWSRAVERIDRVRGDLRWLRGRAGEAVDPEAPEGADHPLQPLLDDLDAALEALAEVDLRFREPEDAKGIQDFRTVSGLLGTARWHLSSSDDAPTPMSLRELEVARRELEGAVEALEGFCAETLPGLRERCAEAALLPLGGA